MEENQNQVVENDELSKIVDKLDEALTLESSPSTSLHDDGEEEEEENDEEFEFSFIGGGLSSPVSAEEVFKDGQIRIISPISGENAEEGEPSYGPPVKKLFVVSSSSENDDVSEGPYCVWKSPVLEMSKKSNSTGFSKLWKVRDLLARSNSDGKDAFVFLTGKNEETASLKKKEKKKKGETTSYGGERKEKKKKKKSAYEELYGEKKKGGGKSYLPYRQDLVGFFTNGSALSRNVHPY